MIYVITYTFEYEEDIRRVINDGADGLIDSEIRFDFWLEFLKMGLYANVGFV